MTIGIYTPSHDAKNLARAYASLGEYNYKWLILLNGVVKLSDVPSTISSDPRVTVAFAPEEAAGNVGRLKRECCERLLEMGATILVELDHDDELTPNAVETLSKAFEGNPELFLYSDTLTTEVFNPAHGWTKKSVSTGGKRYWVHETPEVNSRSLFEIFYAPNHVRAWSREAYLKSGGYTGLPVCDDHKLLIDTYLAGIEMRNIGTPLYIQHTHPEQTQTQRNAEIQKLQAKIGVENLYALALEESRRRGLRAVDLGAIEKVEGYESLNILPQADIVCDVTKGLPFGDNEVGVLRAHDFLEHLPPSAVIPFMNEAYRVLAPGGWLLTHTPSTDGRGAYQDPTHVSFWNSNSFWYYTRMEQAKYVPEITCRFQLARVVNEKPNEWCRTHDIVYCDAALWALKGQRQIGIVEI